MSYQKIIECSFLASFFLLALSILINRTLLRTRISLARKIRGTQIIIAIGLLFLHGILFLGTWNTLIYILVSLTIGASCEFIGIKKGWLFGSYSYTDKAGPAIGGLPIAIPLMWCTVTYLGIWQAELLLAGISPSYLNPYWLLFILTLLLVTFFDFVVDPIAVDEGLWIWKNKGKYTGVPLSNFFGWSVTVVLILLVSYALSHKPILKNGPITWMMYLPAFGYCFLTGVSTRVCFERKLSVPGVIGLVITITCLLGNLYIIIFVLIL